MSGRTTPLSPGQTRVRPHSSAAVYGSHGMAASASASSTGGPPTTVQVAVRVRPSGPPDGSTPSRFLRTVCAPVAGSSTSLAVDGGTVGGPPTRTQFSFDRVFGPEHGQLDVYSFVEPLVDRFLDGYNCTALAYGQTSRCADDGPT